MQNKSTDKAYKEVYNEEDFVNLKSGTYYDEVVKQYGGTDDGWGNLIYPLENGKMLLVSISINKQVLFIETIQEDEFSRCPDWEEREKRENNGKSEMRHSRSDFAKIKEGMSFDEVESILGSDYTLIGNGFTIAKYLTEDFNWVIISCGQGDKVKNVSFAE